MSGANKHPYHLVEASPWPAVGAAAAFTAAVGGVMYMHEVAHGVTVLAIGMALVLATSPQDCHCVCVGRSHFRLGSTNHRLAGSCRTREIP